MAETPLKVWIEREGALLRLRLARPKANILDAAMIAALDGAFAEHAGNTALRGVLIDQEGPHFSFGASVEEHLPGHCAAMLKGLHALLLRMLACHAPIMVAIRGQCLGGGLEFACGGHLLFAARDAQLAQPEMKLAVFAPAASILLPLRVGQSRAEDLLLSGRSIDASTALAWGLVNEVADDPAAAALAYFDAHLAVKSASSLGYALRAARAPLVEQVRHRLAEVEALYLDGLMNTRDAVEGLQAFLDKRTPKWEHK
jgi:cyclohexa-1,5-dienecarbonyl-CoA hydratase